jgi:hypothetical protein
VSRLSRADVSALWFGMASFVMTISSFPDEPIAYKKDLKIRMLFSRTGVRDKRSDEQPNQTPAHYVAMLVILAALFAIGRHY